MVTAPGATPATVAVAVRPVVGSFANVVIYRVPAGRSVVRPSSACRGCGAPVRALDNIPVVSWLVLRGHCRQCKAPISVRYPAGRSARRADLRRGRAALWPVVDCGGEAVLGAGLVVLGFIDLDHMLLPRRVVYVTLVLVGAVFVAGAATGRAVAPACWWLRCRPWSPGPCSSRSTMSPPKLLGSATSAWPS